MSWLLRLVFVALIGWLVFFHLFLDFRGLWQPEAMDQAQAAREVARGNGFTTKTIRPLALFGRMGETVAGIETPKADPGAFPETFNPPVPVLFNAALMAASGESLEYDGQNQVFFLDRVIACGGVACFLGALVLNFFLVARMFDGKIAGITTALLAICPMFWEFGRSGLAQNLLLLEFTLVLWLLFRGLEAQVHSGKAPWWHVLGASLILGLMSGTHWMAIWVVAGAVVFVCLAYQPRVIMGLVCGGIVSLFAAGILVFNYSRTGDPFGAGSYTIFAGIGLESPEFMLRDISPDRLGLPSQGLITSLVENALFQASNLLGLLGGLIAAPVFFLSLIHRFRRWDVAMFRWGILLMWIPVVVATSIWGLPDGILDPNQIHLLFVPAMTAYGLAMISVLFHRMNLASSGSVLLRNAHFLVILLISLAPMFLPMPMKVLQGTYTQGKRSHWPDQPYLPPALHYLNKWTTENEVILSDVPWAVAWYADRTSVWLPHQPAEMKEITDFFADAGHPAVGIYFTPLTTDARLNTEIAQGEWKPWSRMILAGEASVSFGVQISIPEVAPFRHPQFMGSTAPIRHQAWYFSESPVEIRNQPESTEGPDAEENPPP